MTTAIVAVCLAAAAVAGEVQTIRPQPVETKLTNPHMGFIYYGGAAYPDIADVYYTSGLTWGDLEPEEGRYNWDLNSPVWAIAKAALDRGKRVAIRVMPSFQGHPYATPKWVHDLGVKRFPASRIQEQHGQMDLYEPEWWNPIYIEKYCGFIRAFGKEFDGKPWLDWVDIRCYGFWGEGHRFSADVPWPDDVSKRETIKRFVDAHLEAFTKTPSVVQTASDEGEPYPEGTAIDYAVGKGCWMRRDGFGPYINDQEKAFIQANWTGSVMIAENGGAYRDFVAGKISRWWVEGSQPITLEECLDQMLELHCNYIPLGWGDIDWPVLESRAELLRKLWMNMGYRFVIDEVTLPREARAGAEMEMAHRWRNVGVGRIPEAYPLAVFLIDASGVGRRVLLDAAFDQTKWFANEVQTYEHTLAIPADIVPADYLLGVALVHPETEQPAIALGIAGDREGDRTYRIGTVRIH